MYVNVNGIRLFYEEYGSGEPIILLHGNGESHKIFLKLIDKLKEDHKVYAVDSRCHGESDDPEEISYDLMTEDMIELIRKLEIEKPVFYGFSDGGIVGLMIAYKEPDLLSNLIISGANLDPDGMRMIFGNMNKMIYLFNENKLYRMMIREPHITPEDLGKITIPVHVLAGERDVIRREHTQLIADSIRNSTLEFIPGEDHGSYIVDSEKIYHIMKKYL